MPKPWLNWSQGCGDFCSAQIGSLGLPPPPPTTPLFLFGVCPASLYPVTDKCWLNPIKLLTRNTWADSNPSSVRKSKCLGKDNVKSLSTCLSRWQSNPGLRGDVGSICWHSNFWNQHKGLRCFLRSSPTRVQPLRTLWAQIFVSILVLLPVSVWLSLFFSPFSVIISSVLTFAYGGDVIALSVMHILWNMQRGEFLFHRLKPLLFCLDQSCTMFSGDHYSHREALLKPTQLICNQMLFTVIFKNNCTYFKIHTVISTKEISQFLEESDHSRILPF